jgi:hypothetical protein
MQYPTPETTNNGASLPVNVFINEWMASNTKEADLEDGLFSDWFELYNAGTTEADLSGYYLSDSATDKTRFQIPPGRVIPAGGFMRVWADRNLQLNTNVNTLHADFRMNKDGETIALFSPLGVNIDLVTFGLQSDNISQGRYPDGSDAPTQFFTVPTPGKANISQETVAISAGAHLSAGALILSWNSQPAKSYRVEYKNSLTDPAWTLLQTVSASSDTTSLSVSLGAAEARFYRIVLVAP